MKERLSTHAVVRSQQRGVPPIVRDWLLDYGAQVYDGRGAVIRYFSDASVRRMEAELGRIPLRRMSEFLRCYLVEDASDGVVITVGKRYRGCRLPRH